MVLHKYLANKTVSDKISTFQPTSDVFMARKLHNGNKNDVYDCRKKKLLNLLRIPTRYAKDKLDCFRIYVFYDLEGYLFYCLIYTDHND